jgi:hypothetical protein
MSSASQKKVAVIAIHGISDQKPHNTAREVADIINMLPTEPGQELYESTPDASEEHILRIPVRMAKPWEADDVREKVPSPLRANSPSGNRPLQKVWRWIRDGINTSESSGRPLVEVRLDQHQYTGELIDEDWLLGELESDFLNDQLINYEPHDDRQQACDHYRTIRINQEIPDLSSASLPEKITTHVYEMYWGDLSRLGDGAPALANEFYQLLFHLAALSQHVVTLGFLEASSRYPRKSRAWQDWKWYRNFQEAAVALISLWIPLFNLQLLLLLGITAIGKLRFAYDFRLLIALIVAVGILLWTQSRSMAKLKFGHWRWTWLSMVLVLGLVLLPITVQIAGDDIDPTKVAKFLSQLSLNQDPITDHLALAGVSYLILSGLMYVGPVSAYEKRRPGARLVYGLAAAVTAIVLLVQIWLTSQSSDAFSYLNPYSAESRLIPYAVDYASFKTVEVLYTVMAVLWGLFYGTYFGCLVLGAIVQRHADRISRESGAAQDEWFNWRIRVQRSNATARISLAASTALYFVVTMGLWFGLNRLWLLMPSQDVSWYSVSSWFSRFVMARSPDILSTRDFMNQLLGKAVSPLFGLNLLLLIGSLGVAVWAIWPSIARELNQPPDDAQANDLGNWLNQGFRRMKRLGATVLVGNIAVLIPLGYVLGNLLTPDLLAKWAIIKLGVHISNVVMLTGLALLQPLLFLAILASKKFQSSLRSILDAILDVDNYLRIHPVTDNPRSRIFARYISLLRHIATQNYDGIVIVAHSQGAVISADVLRFLQREAQHVSKHQFALDVEHPSKPRGLQADPIVRDLVLGDRKIPISLFTMGAPIHQLYSHAFPHLYHWAAHYDKPSANRISDRPHPQELGVNQWVNAYGSGDYVGRHLWGRSDQMFNAGEQLPSGHPGCYEFCLSDGAHTHYWDGTRAQLAATIQELVSAIGCIDAQPSLCHNRFT